MRKKPFLLARLMLGAGLCACGGNVGTTSSESAAASETTTSTTPPTETLPTTIKILAIGNSFSVDTMEYLYGICNDAGIENIVLGNLYIGGCSLDMHWNNIKSGAAAYRYYRNTSGIWTTCTKSVSDAVLEEDWDYITVQQSSPDSGLPYTYGNLENILNWLEENKPEGCQIYWHMTWAYQQDFTHPVFTNYKNKQMNMYNAIVDTIRDVVWKQPAIAGVIPCGTTIQNLRTSYLGDTLTRDGFHLSFDYGRYVTALTWFAELTGGDAEKINWVPENCAYVKEDIAVMREAVSNAIKDPYMVTESSYKTKEQTFDNI